MAHRRRGTALWEFIAEIEFVPSRLYIAGVGVDLQDINDFHTDFPNADICGWEPNPIIWKGFSDSFPGTLLEAALSDQNGEQKLFYIPNWKNGSTLSVPENPIRVQEAMVRTERLDLYTSEPNSILCLDCEGSELKALQGAGKFLDNVSLIDVEMTGRGRHKDWPSPVEIHRFLMAHGFLQTYIHTIRVVRGQFNAVYVRREIFKPEMCSVMASVEDFELGRF